MTAPNNENKGPPLPPPPISEIKDPLPSEGGGGGGAGRQDVS